MIKEFSKKFDREGDNEIAFVSNVSERITASGWDRTKISMLDIPIGVPFITDVVDCVTEYSQVSLDQVRNHALTYVRTPKRVAQNSYHMYNALMASITPELHKRILVDIEKARINGVGNGTMLFKLIMSECTIDTPATVLRLRGNMFELDRYMVQLVVLLFKGYIANPWSRKDSSTSHPQWMRSW